MWVYIRTEFEEILGVIIAALVVIGISIAAIIIGLQQAEESTKFAIGFWGAFFLFSALATLVFAFLRRVLPRSLAAVIAILLVPGAYIALEAIGDGGLGINMKKHWGMGPKSFYLKTGFYPSAKYARSVESCEESRRKGWMKPAYEYVSGVIEACEKYVEIEGPGK